MPVCSLRICERAKSCRRCFMGWWCALGMKSAGGCCCCSSGAGWGEAEARGTARQGYCACRRGLAAFAAANVCTGDAMSEEIPCQCSVVLCRLKQQASLTGDDTG